MTDTRIIYDDEQFKGKYTITPALDAYLFGKDAKRVEPEVEETEEAPEDFKAKAYTTNDVQYFIDKLAVAQKPEVKERLTANLEALQNAEDKVFNGSLTETPCNIFGESITAVHTGWTGDGLPAGWIVPTPATSPANPFDVLTTTSTAPVVPKKDGNPKTSVGSKKFSLSVMSAAVSSEVAIGMLEGARKYGRHNWRDEGALASAYWDAACRHLIKWWEGEDIDPDSGLSHVVKAIASLYVLRDAMIHGSFTDDRPPALPDGWYEGLDKVAAEIVERYADPRPAHVNKKGEGNA